jgi:hypothetical protein
VSLFAEPQPRECDSPDEGQVIEIPRTVEQEIATFVYRWIREEKREAVTKELRELIAFAKVK